MIRSDTVACQSISPSLPFCTPRPGAGWAPVLRKPGNTHFSGLNAQIPCAVTGHAFSEPIQSHKHGLEASLGPMDLGTVAHLKFQAEGWSVREAPAGTRQAGGQSCPAARDQICALQACFLLQKTGSIHSIIIRQAFLERLSWSQAPSGAQGREGPAPLPERY